MYRTMLQEDVRGHGELAHVLPFSAIELLSQRVWYLLACSAREYA